MSVKYPWCSYKMTVAAENLQLSSSDLYFLFKHVFCLQVCMCTVYTPGAAEARRGGQIPLGLELQMPVIYHVSVGN